MKSCEKMEGFVFVVTAVICALFTIITKKKLQ